MRTGGVAQTSHSPDGPSETQTTFGAGRDRRLAAPGCSLAPSRTTPPTWITHSKSSSPASLRRFLHGMARAFSALFLVFGFVAVAQTPAAPLSPDEFRAALLSKIPQYVTWPARALGPEDRELVIALLGGGAFTNYLEPLVRELRVGDRPVVIRTIARLEDLPRCQILFFPAARTDELAQLPEDRREGLLTVGEAPGFTRLGGVFVLSPKERTLTVNARNARNARLELQSRLLRIAAVER